MLTFYKRITFLSSITFKNPPGLDKAEREGNITN